MRECQYSTTSSSKFAVSIQSRFASVPPPLDGEGSGEGWRRQESASIFSSSPPPRPSPTKGEGVMRRRLRQNLEILTIPLLQFPGYNIDNSLSILRL